MISLISHDLLPVHLVNVGHFMTQLIPAALEFAHIDYIDDNDQDSDTDSDSDEENDDDAVEDMVDNVENEGADVVPNDDVDEDDIDDDPFLFDHELSLI
jgi:hypothetical protein